MKMMHKLILIFSLLAILTTAANSIYFYHARIADLDQRTYEQLTVLSGKIVDEIEQYVGLMDYGLESLTANPEFLDSFHAASLLDEQSDPQVIKELENELTAILHQEPIMEPFYRVSLYAPNGLFISNRIEESPYVENMSDQAREIIAGLFYLPDPNEQPGQRYLITPHADPWTEEFMGVFSAVQAITREGEVIGYIEINAYLDDLAEIFMWQETEGVLVQGIFDNGEQLFRNQGDDIIYTDLNTSGLTRVTEEGIDRLVVGRYSEYLSMTVYVSQDMSIYNQQANEVLRNYVLVAIAILAVTLVFVVGFSLSLTQAIRKLTQRVEVLPVDSVLSMSSTTLTDTVTQPHDQEIHKLETTLNHLMIELQSSMHSEIAMRQGALQAQLNALQLQINPHFVYNTLNIISAKAMESGCEEIIDICDQFAQMLRYASDLRSKTATLGNELANADRYLHLVKVRFEDQLRYRIDVPESMYGLMLPKLTLQPIVENALTHGFAGRTDPREVHIIGTVEGSFLRLVIHDNGNGFSDESLQWLGKAFDEIENSPTTFSPTGGEHLGLCNTYLRLLNASGGRIRMTLHNDSGAVITLTMPVEQEKRHV